MFKFEPGEVLEDTESKEQGVVWARAEYFDGNRLYGLVPEKEDKNPDRESWKWSDEGYLSRVPGKPKYEKPKARFIQTIEDAEIDEEEGA